MPHSHATGQANGGRHTTDAAYGAAPAGAPADAELLLPDLRRRLGPACREWSTEAFESLILEIAHRKVRWDESANGD